VPSKLKERNLKPKKRQEEKKKPQSARSTPMCTHSGTDTKLGVKGRYRNPSKMKSKIKNDQPGGRRARSHVRTPKKRQKTKDKEGNGRRT